MNQMPISECYLSKFNMQLHYHRLIVYIHKVRWVFQLRRVFQIQVPISLSLVILVIGIQDLYTSKYKYTIIGASLSEPHIDEMNARNPYIMFIYVWYVRHARTAIDIVQRCAVYFKRPHENICVSIVTCFFDTLKRPLYYDYTCSLLLF